MSIRIIGLQKMLMKREIRCWNSPMIRFRVRLLHTISLTKMEIPFGSWSRRSLFQVQARKHGMKPQRSGLKRRGIKKT